jgi:hypothetical protein
VIQVAVPHWLSEKKKYFSVEKIHKERKKKKNTTAIFGRDLTA